MGDAEDEIVNDHGFGLSGGNWADNHHKANQYKGSLNNFLGTKSELWIKEGNAIVHKSFHKKHHKSRAHAKRESDDIANADADDDKEVESEMGDGEDEIVNDNGFGVSGNNTGLQGAYAQKRVRHHAKHHHKRHSDEVANGDPTDDREIEQTRDGQDAIVDDHGFRATVNWDRPPKASLVMRESDDVSNADAADDKEIESELGDGEDEIVTDNGFALAGGNWAGDENNVKAGQYDLSSFGPKFGLEPWVYKTTKLGGGDAKPDDKAAVQTDSEIHM
jgi:hypothetical protein